MFVEKLLDQGSYSIDVIDLANHSAEIFSWPSNEMDRITAKVAGSDLVIFASPTYKATYTGLLKAFLDRYQANGLAGVTAIAIQTGGDLSHSMAPTFTLSPLLAELGAIHPGRGLFLPMSQQEDFIDIVEQAALEYATNFHRVATIASASKMVLSPDN